MVASSSQPERPARLADRLTTIRRERFVGRTAEIELFRSVLRAEEPPFVVLHIHGPGGSGKTTLLHEYARLATEAGRPVGYLDGRSVERSPSGLLLAMRQVLELDDALGTLACPARAVLLIDTYELLNATDSWLRETFLPQLPDGVLVVIAGRHLPATAWHTDLAWSGLTRIVSLGNLQPEESHAYLATRGIPDEQHAAALEFTHGHPLALALVADALIRGETTTSFDPASAPDVVRMLLERLVREVLDERHRRALEVCSLARVTTEPLLAEVLGSDDAAQLFDWLRRLSFIEEERHGIFPHDLAREALEAELRWRDLEECRRLGYRIYRHLRSQIAQAVGKERQRLQLDGLYAIRGNAFNRPYFDWGAVEGVQAEPATAGDAGAILAMVRAHEGEDSARIAAHWLRRQPEAFLVFRDLAGEQFGFMAHLSLRRTTPEDCAVDPALPPILEFMRRHGSARNGEEIAYLRYWMHREAYQAVTAAINLAAMNVVTYCITHPSIAWNFVAMASPDFWLPHFSGVNWPRAAEADFTVGGRRYGVFAHDWRAEPAHVWVAGAPHPPMPFVAPEHVVGGGNAILDQAAFADAVRHALRDYARPERLATSPLLRSQALIGLAGDSAAPAALQALLRAAVASLANSPKDMKLHRAVWHTFIEPAPTQERAAELLGLPFNTYRYQLAKGIERVTGWLWWREISTRQR